MLEIGIIASRFKYLDWMGSVHVVMHELSWLWLSCMRSLYTFSVIMHDVDMLI